jgi:hypothetical protein
VHPAVEQALIYVEPQIPAETRYLRSGRHREGSARGVQAARGSVESLGGAGRNLVAASRPRRLRGHRLDPDWSRIPNAQHVDASANRASCWEQPHAFPFSYTGPGWTRDRTSEKRTRAKEDSYTRRCPRPEPDEREENRRARWCM